MSEENQLLTLQEVAEYLSVSLSTIYRYIERENNPLPVSFVSDRTKRVLMSDLLKWLENMTESESQVGGGE